MTVEAQATAAKVFRRTMIPTRLVPQDDRVVVLPDEALEVTEGGIVLPDQAKERPVKGLVLAVGPGKWLDNGSRGAPSIKPGDVVLYTKWAGEETKEGVGKAAVVLRILRASDVLAVEAQ